MFVQLADPDLKFMDGRKDQGVGVRVEKPADRQVILSVYTIDSGRPNLLADPLGVDKPRGAISLRLS